MTGGASTIYNDGMSVDNSTEIERLQAILNAGATQVVVDGQTVTFDFRQIRARIRELKAEDDTNDYTVRPTVARMNLSTGW